MEEEEHQLVSADAVGPRHRAVCACGEWAWVLERSEASLWVELHRRLPGLCAAELATLHAEREV